MIKVLFIDSVHPVLEKILAENNIHCEMAFNWPMDEVMNKLSEYDGFVIRSRFKITGDIMKACPRLKFIARAGAGMENIDVAYALKNNIECLHAPEGNRDAVAEHALGMLLCLFNNILRSDKEVRHQKWNREGNRGVELQGKTVGVIGYGNMGSAFCERLKGFGVKILVHDKYKTGFGNDLIEECSLEKIFEEADVLSIHIPLTEETFGMINEEFINSFKKPIYLINTARGKVLKTSALVDGLKNGRVKGACIDVLEYESVSFENIALSEIPSDLAYLFNSDKVILTPHIAGWTHESNEKIAMVLAEKIVKLA